MMETANKVTDQNFISRLSSMQKDILSYLATSPHPHQEGSDLVVGHLPRTGDIIDALG